MQCCKTQPSLQESSVSPMNSSLRTTLRDSLHTALAFPKLPGNSVIFASLSVCSWTHCIQSHGQQPIFHLIPLPSKPVLSNTCPLLPSPCPELPRLKFTECSSLHNPRYKGVKNVIFLHFYTHYLSREANITTPHAHEPAAKGSPFFWLSKRTTCIEDFTRIHHKWQ